MHLQNHSWICFLSRFSWAQTEEVAVLKITVIGYWRLKVSLVRRAVAFIPSGISVRFVWGMITCWWLLIVPVEMLIGVTSRMWAVLAERYTESMWKAKTEIWG